MKPNHPGNITILVVALAFAVVGVILSHLIANSVSAIVGYVPICLSAPLAMLFLIWLDARMP